MPVEVVRSVEAACKAGKLSSRMKALKSRLEKERGKKISCSAFGEAVASMVENKRKRAKGGEGDILRADACWTQAAEGGSNTKDRGPFWLKVIEPETRLNSMFGPVEVDELAHVAALDHWKDDWSSLKGHIDHKKDKEVDLGVLDAKYEVGTGLSLYMKPADPYIYDNLVSRKAKPSIEIDFFDDDYDGRERVIENYRPTGLGIMIDGKAMGKDIGPHEPDLSTAIGGEEMTEEGDDGGTAVDEAKVNGFFEDLGKMAETDKDGLLSKQEEYRKQFKQMYGENEIPWEDTAKFVNVFSGLKETEDRPDTDTKDDERYAELLKKMKEIEKDKKSKEELLSQKDNNIKELEKIMIDRILKEAEKEGVASELIDVEGRSFEDVQKEIDIEKRRMTIYREGLPDKGINPLFPRQEKKPDVDSNGNITDKGYEKLVSELNSSTSSAMKKEKDIWKK